jgi:hypothetical protein
MTPTENFRRQHSELGEIARQLRDHLTKPSTAVDVDGIRRLLAQLTGKLSVHKTMEEDALYPRLRVHSDPKVRATADRFLREFGQTYTVYLAFAKRWGVAGAIEQDTATFIRDTADVLRALSERIVHENQELYEMVDRLE